MKLTEFLLARIAEDERRAGMAAGSMSGWTYMSNHVADIEWIVGQFMYDHSPERVLAECKVRRKMVELFGYAESFDTASKVGWYPATVAIRTLALPYANHPDYREEWKP